MATPDNDDDEVEVDEEAEEGGDLDTSLKLFMKKPMDKRKRNQVKSQVVSMGT